MPSFAPYPRINAYIRLIRLDRPVGIYLLLWPPLWGLWLAAEGIPDVTLLAIFILGVIVMRSAGCAINDAADFELDRRIERTRNRPIARGELTPRAGVITTAVLLGIALGLALMLPPLSLLLAIPAALLAVTYPFAKRWHSLPQLHLGIAFAWSVPMAITATTHTWPPVWGWLLFAATILWVTAYDTLYAMADREEDLRAGNRSTAILFGAADRSIVAVLYALFFLLLLLLGWQQEFGLSYIAAMLIAGFLILQHLSSIRERHAEDCLRAFTQNPRIGAVIWVGIALEYVNLEALHSLVGF